jgi:hypothetical protein
MTIQKHRCVASLMLVPRLEMAGIECTTNKSAQHSKLPVEATLQDDLLLLRELADLFFFCNLPLLRCVTRECSNEFRQDRHMHQSVRNGRQVCGQARQWQQGKRGRGESILAKAEAISSVLDAFMRGARREGQVAVSLHTFSSSTFLIISGVAEFTGGASMKRCWIGVSGCKTQGHKTE